MTRITVFKCDVDGKVTWQYRGTILEQTENRIVINARFNQKDTPFMGIEIRRGDLFIETYFLDRWYNIFEIHDQEEDHIKGWYCNIGRPAVLKENSLFYTDLALDLWVTPDGEMHVLDEDEFEALGLCAQDRENALIALGEVKGSFALKFQK